MALSSFARPALLALLTGVALAACSDKVIPPCPSIRVDTNTARYVNFQKNERDLEDFNTKINLIRLLQPEFLSAQSFQIWNKAFNISVQIPSLPDRYAVILDAGEDARALDRGRPNSVDLLLMLNQVYQQKLGQTTGDSVYYRQHVRDDLAR